MSLFKKTPEEQAAAEARKQAEQEQRERAAFDASPQGQARLSYARGDLVHQCRLILSEQTAIIAPMYGATTGGGHTDVSATLNAVCAEGWRPIAMSVAFVIAGQESRDKFLSSGQQVAVSGQTVGYYLFVRDDTARTVNPPE